MAKSPVIRLIEEMVGKGLSPAEASYLKLLEASFRGKLSSIRLAMLDAARVLKLDPDDPFIYSCIDCIAHLHEYGSCGGQMPKLVSGGMESAARCVRCSSVCEFVHDDQEAVVRSKFEKDESRRRYMVVKNRIERRHALLYFRVVRWYAELEALATSLGVEINEPLRVF